jgi:hypothetical protein
MTRKPAMNGDNKWHLDKRVPIALIVTMMLQTGGIIWWAASASERLSALEKKVDSTAPQADRLTRVEVKLDVVQDNLGEIKRILQQRTR